LKIPLLLIKIKRSKKNTEQGLIRLIGMVPQNGAMLSMTDKYDSVNECTQEISELIKLNIQGVWQNAHEIY